jgi:magnesium chelatase subunit D
MAGKRTEACYAMADYFLRHSRGRLALVTFRGDEAKVLSSFTRSRRQLLEELQNLKPTGLTPLASGLLLSLEVVNRARARRPQVILVTDGEPTRSLWTRNALQDALRAAELFRQSGITLVCCGLAANESTLAEITRRSAGRLYVLRDFSERSLLFVTRRMLV